MERGVYSVPHGQSPLPHPFVMDHEEVKEKKIYNFWSGVKYTVILSVLLFWIPPFGQMITGYVGGRKAGTPLKGLLATLVPVSVLFFIFGLTRIGLFTDEIGWIFTLPEAGANAAAGLPLVGSIAQFSVDYIQTFIHSFGFGETWLTPYILTVIFGYVGGIMSLQHQKEMEVEHRLGNMPTSQAQHPVEEAYSDTEADAPLIMGKKPEGWDD